MTEPTKDKLLEHYASKPVKRFLQIDGFHTSRDQPLDPIIDGDEEGDTIAYGIDYELMSTPARDMPVRLLIHEAADMNDVRRLLGKAIAHLDHGFALLREEEERELLARAGVESQPPF